MDDFGKPIVALMVRAMAGELLWDAVERAACVSIAHRYKPPRSEEPSELFVVCSGWVDVV